MKPNIKKCSQKGRKAFTLMEVIITILIISSVATLAIVNLNKVILIDRERNAVARLQALMGAMRIYKARTGAYPTDADGTFTNYDTELKPILGTSLSQEPYDFSCVNASAFGQAPTEIECFLTYPPATPWNTPGRWGLTYQTDRFDPKFAADPVNEVFCDDDPCRYCSRTGCP